MKLSRLKVFVCFFSSADLRIVVGRHLRQHLVKRVHEHLLAAETTPLVETLLRCLAILALNSTLISLTFLPSPPFF